MNKKYVKNLINLPAKPKMESSSSSSSLFVSLGKGSASATFKPSGPNLKQLTLKAASTSSSALNSKPKQALKFSLALDRP